MFTFASVRSVARFVGFILVFASVCYLSVCVLALGSLFLFVRSLVSGQPALAGVAQSPQLLLSGSPVRLCLPASAPVVPVSPVSVSCEVVEQLAELRVVELRALPRSRGFTGVSRASRGRLLALLG